MGILPLNYVKRRSRTSVVVLKMRREVRPAEGTFVAINTKDKG